jgi:hypothetical protein
MVKSLIFNDIMKDANLVRENYLDACLGLITSTTKFPQNNSKHQIQTFECVE